MSSLKEARSATLTVAQYLASKYPTKTAEKVAADTGCTVSTVKRWLYSESAPSFECFRKLILAYGPDILAAVLPPTSWVERARASLHEDKLRADLAAAQKRLADYHAANH
jgi:hypothetical protein